MRRMPRVVVDGVDGHSRAAVLVERLSRIRVNVEARKVAAGNIHANSMAFGKENRGRVELDAEPVDLAGRHEAGFLEGVAVAGAHNAVAYIQLDALRKILAGRIDIH